MRSRGVRSIGDVFTTTTDASHQVAVDGPEGVDSRFDPGPNLRMIALPPEKLACGEVGVDVEPGSFSDPVTLVFLLATLR